MREDGTLNAFGANGQVRRRSGALRRARQEPGANAWNRQRDWGMSAGALASVFRARTTIGAVRAENFCQVCAGGTLARLPWVCRARIRYRQRHPTLMIATAQCFQRIFWTAAATAFSLLLIACTNDAATPALQATAAPTPTAAPKAAQMGPPTARSACREIDLGARLGVAGIINASEYLDRLEGALDLLRAGAARGENVRAFEEPLARALSDLKAGTETSRDAALTSRDATLMGALCSVFK